MALEVAFPKCAIIRLEDWEVEDNREWVSRLQDGREYKGYIRSEVWDSWPFVGSANERLVIEEGWGCPVADGDTMQQHGYRGAEDNDERLFKLQDGTENDGYMRSTVWGGWLVAGSAAEGLAIEEGWGHPTADRDTMKLLGGSLGVHVPQGHRPPGRAVLSFKPEACPPAYCQIKVTDAQALMGVDVGLPSKYLDAGCIYRSKGVDWLHTNNTLRRLQGYEQKISGPAGQSYGGLYEYVPTLVCSDAHPDMDQYYVQRHRKSWPSSQLIKLMKQLPILLVLTGHKHSDEFPLQARFSWSHCEMKLINTIPLNIKHVYIAVKYAFKRFMKTFRGANGVSDGRSQVGSYALKTAFLRHLERRPPTMIRSQLLFMYGLLHDLDGYLEAGELPHYFLPDCNLLATVGLEERRIARNVISHILSDPLRAILTCPTDPQDIYGKVPPDTLVASFHNVSSHPTCADSCENLCQLLCLMDVTRRERFQWQRERDEGWVSDRVELVGLVDMLWKQMQDY